MGRLNKKEFVEKHGEDAWKEWLNKAKLANRKYYSKNKETVIQRKKEYYSKNSETIKQQNKEHYSEYYWTQTGRAKHLLNTYKKADEKSGRGECTLSKEWIIEHIFNSKCVYCGEDDWQKLGCDRIDNSLPHTKDNCVCSCSRCNIQRNTKTYTDFKAKK